MKDRKGIEILPSDSVSYFGDIAIPSDDLMVIGIHKSDDLITLFYEDHSACKFHEIKVNPEEIEVQLRNGEPRSSVKKRGKKAWGDLQDDNNTLKHLEMRKKGELDEWYQPIFTEVVDDEY